MVDLGYWQQLGDQLGWRSSFRDPIPNGKDCLPRQRGYIDYLIFHHTATPNEALAAELMLPGGRTVTCNRLLGTDGKWRPNIPEGTHRAYTSSSWLDDIADTTEVVNTSGSPSYGVSDLQLMALAIWAVEKFRAGRLKEISRRYIIGHYEVSKYAPGTSYATSCPAANIVEADRRLDLITEVALLIQTGLLGPRATTIDPSKKGNPVGDVQYYARVHNGKDHGEWMIGGVELFDDPDNDPEESGYYTWPGYWVTTKLEVAIQWAYQFSYYPPETRAVRLEVDDYIAQQAMLINLHERWVAGMKSAFGVAGTA